MSGLQANSPNQEYARQAIDFLRTATYQEALAVYEAVLSDPNLDKYVIAELGKHDRYFLVTNILNRSDAYHPWLYERCREVEAEPDECLDLWARDHYKTTFITFGGSFQEIINDPEITIGIFSHTRPISKRFEGQIKRECEFNPKLHYLWPHIFWENPAKEAPVWSLDDGLVMKRKLNPAEKTVEAYGLVEGMPTSGHWALLIFNDVVTDKSVTNAEQIQKTTEAWELAQNLSRSRAPRRWHEGTRYSHSDTYRILLDRQALKPRVYPATKDGTMDGEPVYLSPEIWAKKKADASPYTIACQQLQNPIAGEEKEFQDSWIRRWEVRPHILNIAILVDPASSRKKGSSNTAMAVIGIDSQHNKYLLDGACHRMNLTEKWAMLKYLRNKWVKRPGIQVVKVGYEKYGMQADIEHFQEMMRIEKGYFPIEEVSWTRDGEQAKHDRIRRLIPDHQNWRFFYPYEGEETEQQRRAVAEGRGVLVSGPIKRKDHEGRIYNLVDRVLRNEYAFFPAIMQLDFMDAMSRFYDLDMQPPNVYHKTEVLPEAVPDY